MIVFLLEKCRMKSTPLFKTMKASDTPNPATGKQKGAISASQFELCIRSAGINAPRAVFNVLLEVAGMDEDGEVDYVKFLEDLEIEENMGVEEMKGRREIIQHQMAAEEQQKAYMQRQREEYQAHQQARAHRTTGLSASRLASRDTRLLIEVDSLPDGRNPGQRTQSFFKPKHLTSAFTNGVGTVYVLPGGPLGVEMVDSQEQPPVEQKVLDGELHFMRDFVHKDKVEAQKAARCQVGN